MWKIMKQCTDPIGAGCSHIYRQITDTTLKYTGTYIYTIYISTEWKEIFFDAGFSDDYKSMPVLGPYSVIEIYP
jgi:hypothetical protein